MLTLPSADATAPLPSKFDERYLRHTFRTRPAPGLFAWAPPTILVGRDAQFRGRMSRSAPLGVAMMADAAIWTAVNNRIAPSRALPHETRGLEHPDEQSEAIRQEAEHTWREGGDALTPGAKADAFKTLVQHGCAVYQNVCTPRADGSRIDFKAVPFPARCIDWDPQRRCLRAQTDGDGLVDVIHGDGKWVVVQLFDDAPWESGAIVTSAMLWSDRAYGVLARGKDADAHGEGKPIGELPPGIATTDPEGDALRGAIEHLPDQDWGAVVPHGTNLRYLESLSQAWQIHRERIGGGSSDIFRVYLGQDGSVSKTGGNYIKDGILAGVRYDLVEGDLRAFERGVNSGTLRVWAALNFGRFDTPAHLFWLIPDPDEDARRESVAKRTASYNADLEAFRKNGLIVDAAFAAEHAKRYGIKAPPFDPEAFSSKDFFAYELTEGVISPNDLRRLKYKLSARTGGDEYTPDRLAREARERDAANALNRPPAPAPPGE